MRKVVCKSKETRLPVPDMYCLRARPKTIEECSIRNCSDWIVSPWSEVFLSKSFINLSFKLDLT
jgi:hypothetical protein